MVAATLQAALKYGTGSWTSGCWTRATTSDARRSARRLGVHHFSRKGVEKGNQPKGPYRAKTKHGNYNAWLDAHGDEYDFFASVDTDHVPLQLSASGCSATSATRTSPSSSARRCTATTTPPSPRPPSRQQFLFHALIQRAGNRYRAPDVRRHQQRRAHQRAASRSAGCTTRSPRTWPPASSCTAHRNPATGRHWRSVYTPDVLAVGEGPGVLDRLLHPADALVARARTRRSSSSTGRRPFSLPPGKLFNYTLMIIFYPMSAAQLAPRRR